MLEVLKIPNKQKKIKAKKLNKNTYEKEHKIWLMKLQHSGWI